MCSRHALKGTSENARADFRRLDSLRIRSLPNLASHLECSVRELRRWAASPQRYYSRGTFVAKGRVRPKTEPRGRRFRHAMRCLNRLLQRLVFPDAVHGGVKGRSYRSNAVPHLNQPIIVKLDIRRFFDHVTTSMVDCAFRHRCRCTPEIAAMLARIVTPFGCLPQGSPPSAVIANIAIEPLIRRLECVARQHGAVFTQYVDDTTMSGPAHLRRLVPLCVEIIREHGFQVSGEKIKVVDNTREQIVTGNRVDHGAGVPSEVVRDVRRQIRALEQTGSLPPECTLTSLQGKIRHMRILNTGAGKHYARRLRKAIGRASRMVADARHGHAESEADMQWNHRT